MPQAFKCPSCAAPLEYEGGDFQRCDFCGTNVLVPKNELQSGTNFGLDNIIGKAHQLKEIVQLARSGNKIEAIKKYRELFGTDLATSKDAVERLERGEAVNFQNVSFQTPITLSKEDSKKVMKAAGIFGGSMILIAIIPAIIGLVIAGFVVWKVWGVVDQASSRGQKPTINQATNSFAEQAAKFGGKGIGPGLFEDNRYIGTDANGRIYSAEHKDGKVQVLDANGKFIAQWIAAPESYISDMAVDRKGMACIAIGSDIKCFEGETGKKVVEKKSVNAEGIAFAPDGRLYALTSKGSITIFDASLNPVSEFKDAGKSANAKSGFEMAAIDGNGNIFTLDRQSGDILKFSSAGQFITRIKKPGNGVSGIAVDGKGRIYASEVSQIHIFDNDGAKVGSFPETQAFGMAFNDAGELFVASRPYVVKYRIKN